MTHQGTTIACWGRDVAFGQAALPEQIRSRGEDLLGAPMRLTAVCAGRRLELRNGQCRVVGAKGHEIDLAASAQALSVGLGLWLWARHGLSPAFAVLAGAGFLVALGGHLRFLCAPGPGTSRLRPFAEIQVFGLLLGGVLA